MKYDELAFFNQQLAAMLRDGIPLESALSRLCADMQKGGMRAELEQLQADLARGVPLAEAARSRNLPELYRRMLEVGAQSNNLPAILTMLADHYERRHLIATKLKGLMVYPAIVLAGTFLLSCFLAVLAGNIDAFARSTSWVRMPNLTFAIWLPPILLALLLVAVVVVASIPSCRRKLRWRIPGFREDSIANCASALAIMLKSGVPLDAALGLVEHLECGTGASLEFARWRQRLISGRGKFSDMSADGLFFPPLFLWTVAQSEENLAAGFERAAELYEGRANYRSDMLLYSALPSAIVALGVVIILQIQPVIATMASMMRTLIMFD